MAAMIPLVRPQQPVRFRHRSLMAFVLAPEAPVAEWLTQLDKWIRSSPGFFVGRPVVLNLAGVTLSESAVSHVIAELAERGIRVMGLEGVEPSKYGPALPPVLTGGRPADEDKGAAPAAVANEAPPSRQEPSSLVLQEPIRSGQSVIFPYGDVTVLGSVSSGAELVAGGSIHIYGALRGRAMAGSKSNPRARIFCRKNEAELLAIDGYYRTAEDMHADLRGRPVQVWLENASLVIAAME
jgi:septum site-determining protein MinC